MATDRDGNTLAVGDVVYVPAKITSIVSTSLNLATPEDWGGVTNFNVPASKTKKGNKPPWPDVP